MKNPHRFVSKVTGNGKVIVDSGIRTAYSNNPEALKASAYFMYKKVTVAELFEIESVNFDRVSKVGYDADNVTTNEDCIVVKTTSGNVEIYDGEHHYTAVATLCEPLPHIGELVQTILLDKEYPAKTIDIIVNVDESLVVNDTEVAETEVEEMVEEVAEVIPTYDLAELDGLHIPRYDVYVVTEMSEFAPFRVELNAGQILSSVQHITGTSSEPYSINTTINAGDFRYRIVTKEGIVNVMIDTISAGPITNEMVHMVIQKLKVINVKTNLVNFISITPSDFDKFDGLNEDPWCATLNTVERISWANLDVADNEPFTYGDLNVANCYTEYGIVKVADEEADLDHYSPEKLEFSEFVVWTASFGNLAAYAFKRKGHNTTPLFIIPIKGVDGNKLREIVRVLIQLTELTVHDHFCLLSLDEAGALNTELISNINKEKENTMEVESLNVWFSETDHIRVATDEKDGGVTVNHIFRLDDMEGGEVELFNYSQVVGSEFGSRYYNIGVADFISSKYSVTGPVALASVVTEGVAFVSVAPMGETNLETYEVLEADAVIHSLKELDFWKDHDGIINEYVVAFSLELNLDIIRKIEAIAGVATSTTDEDWTQLMLKSAGLFEECVAVEAPDFVAPVATDGDEGDMVSNTQVFEAKEVGEDAGAIEQLTDPAVLETKYEHDQVFTEESTGDAGEDIPAIVEETKVIETEEKPMSTNKPYIEVPVAAYLVNHTGVEVDSNVAVVPAGEVEVSEQSTCVGVIIDFNDYFKASEIMTNAIERGLAIYQLRYLEGGASNEIIRLK